MSLQEWRWGRRRPWAGFWGQGLQEERDGRESWRSPREGKGRVPTLKLHRKRVGQSALDSLLSDDVIPRQGGAGHPSHLHVVGDLREVQAQVHAMDGHSSPSFRWSRHRQDLREGNGVTNLRGCRDRGSSALALPRGRPGHPVHTRNLGEWSRFPPLCRLSRLLTAPRFIRLPRFLRSLIHSCILLLKKIISEPWTRGRKSLFEMCLIH